MLMYFVVSNILLCIPSLTTPAFIPTPAYFNGNVSAYSESASRVLVLTMLKYRIDWVLNQGTISNSNSNPSGGKLAHILTQNNGGTRIYSTRYFHHGKIIHRVGVFLLYLHSLDLMNRHLSISEDRPMERCCYGFQRQR
jgi:hypothetical protein